jgi:hypothetical protein
MHEKQKILMIEFDEKVRDVMNFLEYDGQIIFYLQMIALIVIILFYLFEYIILLIFFDVYDLEINSIAF